MNILLYFLIFISKVVENALATLRLIVVSNGKKLLGAILQGCVAFVWVLVTGVVVANISKDPLKIVAFVIGSFVGSFVGSFIEEKMALGSNMITGIVDEKYGEKVVDALRNKGFAVTVTKGLGKDKKRDILMVMVARKKQHQVVSVIKHIDSHAMVVAESASTIRGGYDQNENIK